MAGVAKEFPYGLKTNSLQDLNGDPFVLPPANTQIVVTGNYTLSSAGVSLLVTRSADLTISLPTAVGKEGQEVNIYLRDSSRFKVTISPNGTELISGKTSLMIDIPNLSLTLESVGNSGWAIR